MDVELGVALGCLGNVLEKLRGQDEEALLLRHIPASHLGVFIGKLCVGERSVARCLTLSLVDILCQVFRDETIEQEAQDVCLEIPAVHGAAHLVGYAPDGLVELRPLCVPALIGCQEKHPFLCSCLRSRRCIPSR